MAYAYAGIREHRTLNPAASNAVCDVIVTFSAVGLWSEVRRRRAPFTFLLTLYVLGLTAAQLLVEVAVRYHDSGLAAMVPLAGGGSGAIHFCR